MIKSLFERYTIVVLFVFFGLLPKGAFAQANYESAREYLDAKQYQKAHDIYKTLYSNSPDSKDIYDDYLFTLMALKDFKQAESVAKSRLKKESNNPIMMVALGNIYKADKKEKKANELFDQALSYINGDDIVTQQIANDFSKNNNDEWAIKTYERAVQVTQSPALYAAALARLYNKTDRVEEAISILIKSQNGMQQMYGDVSTESSLLEIIGTDADKQKLAQKAIIKLVNEQPDNYNYTYLLTWIFSVQNNWSQALVQVQALEKRSNDKGKLLIEFANSAAKKNEFFVAEKAYNTILDYGEQNPRYQTAREGILQMQVQQIENNPTITKAEIDNCAKGFETYLEQFPAGFGSTMVQQYAYLEAQHNNNISKAIALLQKAISLQIGNKFFIGNCKLQLGDYYIISGDVWEAALAYAQVDKGFREDALGEEARFRNAKLSYYQNDFEQAQGQLSVLKASTSELIANDALFLSVQITENIPKDSNMVPLERFAAAELLLFQNKDKEAESLLDSIAQAFPKNALADDILLQRSKIASKHKDYNKAIDYLKQIIERYGKDVLADDAQFRIAEIYAKKLNNNTAAKQAYEQLIIDFPGSSFVQQSQKMLREMEEQR